MPLIATRGAASAQGFGEFAQTTAPVYIEDVFSTYLYTGNGSTQTITNNIDLSTKGGLVWIKSRVNPDSYFGHWLADTQRGVNNVLQSDNTGGNTSLANTLTAFNSNGFSIGNILSQSTNSATYASWTFRKQPKFFDIVTYTGNGSNRTVAHNLGSTPGCIIVKSTSASAWTVYHRSIGATKNLILNTTAAEATNADRWNNTAPTSTEFSIGTNGAVNGTGETYVAYLFAHDAGGFGLTGSDNVISCGSYTNNSSAPVSVNLGWEPQWILVKVTSGTTGGWQIVDNMRGINYGATKPLAANDTAAEGNEPQLVTPTATGFDIKNNVSANFNSAATTGTVSYIYIAIRRGPMKTPTVGTSVFSPNAYTGTGAGQTYTTNFPVDMTITSRRSPSGANHEVYDRLRPWYAYLFTDTTAEEGTAFGTTNQWLVDRMDSVKWNTSDGFTNVASDTYCTWNFRRAPGFFDVVCYTGTGVNSTSFNHNLTVTPELVIIKRRDVAGGWLTNSRQLLGDNFLTINSTNAASFGAYLISNTATTFTVSDGQPNASGNTYVAYLFASLSGVSKVGSYTGTGALQTVNCGFTSGARFVLIKRTDSTGDWWVYDSARGISSGNDPYLFLNSTAAEVTNTNYVDTTSVGFQVTAAAPAGLNANGGNFIFLAVA